LRRIDIAVICTKGRVFIANLYLHAIVEIAGNNALLTCGVILSAYWLYVTSLISISGHLLIPCGAFRLLCDRSLILLFPRSGLRGSFGRLRAHYPVNRYDQRVSNNDGDDEKKGATILRELRLVESVASHYYPLSSNSLLSPKSIETLDESGKLVQDSRLRDAIPRRDFHGAQTLETQNPRRAAKHRLTAPGHRRARASSGSRVCAWALACF